MEVIRLVYWLESDTFATDEVWEALSGGQADLEDRLQAAYCRLKATASHVLSNGYLMERKALELCRGRRRVLELLCSRPIDGRQPLLHRKGDVCDCLGEDWSEPYAYRIHAFLKRNPARAEVERNKAMKADRRDYRLRALVYERDGGCCRYCRSGPLPPNAGRSKDRRKVRAFDHVDPEAAAGPDGEGYVVACDRCNAAKGHRLPEEADMVLLDEPTQEERVAWLARELLVFDRPLAARQGRNASQDRSANAPGTLRDRDRNRDPDRDSVAIADRDPGAFADGERGDEPTGELRPDPADSDRDRGPARSENPPGSGRAAGDVHPGREPPPRKPPDVQPRRTSAEPDIYTGRSRANPPEYRWPPGSVPATAPDWPPGSAVLGAIGDQPRVEEERPPWT